MRMYWMDAARGGPCGHRPGIDRVVIVFEGLEGHHFERVSSGVKFSDISDIPLSAFLRDRETELAEGHRLVGAPGGWQGSVSAAEVYLKSRGAHYFEIASSYGFSGWVLAASVRQSRLGGDPGLIPRVVGVVRRIS
jgi:hypothetical protein